MFKRKPEERKIQAREAKNKHEDSSEHQSLLNRLGISSTGGNRDKVIFELNKVKGNMRLRTQLKLTEADFKRYGLD